MDVAATQQLHSLQTDCPLNLEASTIEVHGMGDAFTAQPNPQRIRLSNLFPVGSIVEVRPDEADFKDAYLSGKVVSPVSYSKKVIVEYHTLFEEEDGSTPLKEEVDIRCLRPSPAPQEIVEGFEPGDTVDAFYMEDWWVGVVSEVVEGDEKRYIVVFKNPPDELEFAFSDLRVHWDWVNGIWIRPHKKTATGLMFDVGIEVEVSESLGPHGAWYSGTIVEYLGNRTRFLVKGSGANSDQPPRIEMVNSLNVRPSPPLLRNKNFALMENVDAFFDNGWWSGVIRQKLADKKYVVFFKQLNMVREFDDLNLRYHMDLKNGKWFASYQKPKQLEIVESSEKRNRGRPRKSLVETIHNITDYLNKNDDDPRIILAALAIDMETLPLPNHVKTLNKDIVFSGGSDIQEFKRTSTKKREGMVVEESINPQDNHITEAGRKNSTFLRVQEASPVSFEEQPMENGEMNQGDLSVLEVVSERHHESEVSIPMTVPQSLPFIKKSILWKTLEAMDPFQRMPQNPHFQPLQRIKESFREGKAIGYMVTFAGEVEKIYGLQFGDPNSVTDNILESLAELENHGFNAIPIKDRLSKLLEVKEKMAVLVGDMMEINVRILEHGQQEDMVKEEIDGIKKEIQKKEKKLSVLESVKEKEEGGIVAAVHCLMKTKEHIKDVKREFECLISSAF